MTTLQALLGKSLIILLDIKFLSDGLTSFRTGKTTSNLATVAVNQVK